MAAKSKAIVPTIVPEDPAVKEIMDGFKARLKDGSTASDAWKQPDSFQKACLDLVQAHLHGKLSVSNMIVVIKEASIPTDEEKLKYLLSAVWMTATQTAPTDSQWKAVCGLLKDLTASGVVDPPTLRTTMEFNQLVEAGLIKDEDMHTKRLIKVNTNLVYKQQKYNLLREEVEGYSRLSLLLSQQVPVEAVLSAIGGFDLDPNRVLDIILDFMETHSSLSYMELLKSFRVSNIVHILGNKFLAAGPQVTGSLFRLAAVLIMMDYVDLTALLAYLTPSLSETASAVKAYCASLKSSLRAPNSAEKEAVLRQCGIAPIPHPRASWLTRAPLSTEAVQVVKEVVPVPGAVRPPPPAYPPPPSVLTAVAVVPAPAPAPTPTVNQPLALAVALAEVSAWDKLQALLALLCAPEEVPADVTVSEAPPAPTSITPEDILLYHPALTKAVLGMLRRASAEVYGTLKPSKAVLKGGDASDLHLPAAQYPQLAQISDLLPHLLPFMDLIGYHLAEDPVAFVQVVTLSHAFIQSGQDVQPLLVHVLLPCIQSLTMANNQVCNVTYLSSQLYNTLALLPYAQRYMLYDLQTAVSKPMMVAYTEQLVLQAAKHELKRLAKENAKTIGRNLAKYMQAAPMVVITHLLNQIESFSNLVPYVVELLKYGTPLVRDITSLAVVRKLSKDSKVKNHTSYAEWFISLSKFIGGLYGRFPGTELKGLLHYLLQSLSKSGEDLLIVRDLLSIMGGCCTLLEVSIPQLEGLSGGKYLRNEILATTSSVTIKKKASQVLRDELIASQTALPLLLFIAKIRSKVLYDGEMPLKVVSNLYDTAQDALMQFADFLSGDAKYAEQLAKMMPSFSVLVEDIGLSMPLAYQLVRPLIRAATEGSVWHMHTMPFSSALGAFFWSWHIYDIYTPAEKYSSEIKRLKDRYTELDVRKLISTSTIEFNKLTRTRETDMKQLMQTIALLSDEVTTQRKHVELNRVMLNEKGFFSDTDDIAKDILQSYILPRVMLSPLDAVYCAKFLVLLHDVKVPKFSLLHAFHEVVQVFSALLFSTTEAEASFLGYALHEVLSVLDKWTDKDIFTVEYEAKANPADLAALYASIASDASAPVSSTHEQFISIVQHWHGIICTSLLHALEGADYIYIRSGLVLLTKISPHYPLYPAEGVAMTEAIQTVMGDKREDIKIMGRSVHVVLKKRSVLWAPPVDPAVLAAPAAIEEKENKDNKDNRDRATKRPPLPVREIRDAVRDRDARPSASSHAAGEKGKRKPDDHRSASPPVKVARKDGLSANPSASSLVLEPGEQRSNRDQQRERDQRPAPAAVVPPPKASRFAARENKDKELPLARDGVRDGSRDNLRDSARDAARDSARDSRTSEAMLSIPATNGSGASGYRPREEYTSSPRPSVGPSGGSAMSRSRTDLPVYQNKPPVQTPPAAHRSRDPVGYDRPHHGVDHRALPPPAYQQPQHGRDHDNRGTGGYVYQPPLQQLPPPPQQQSYNNIRQEGGYQQSQSQGQGQSQQNKRPRR